MADNIISGIESSRVTSTLLGHNHAEITLVKAWKTKKIPHAWIFSGPKGIGKATLAWQFIRLIHAGDQTDKTQVSLKTNPDNQFVKHIIAGTHPDSQLVRRSNNARPPYKLRKEISVEDIRSMNKFLRFTPALSDWRTVIIDSADEMNLNAQNALLKTLEEPPANTVIILVSHMPSKLLPTIKSRCQNLSIHPLSKEYLVPIINQSIPNLSENERIILMRLSNGSPGRALDLAEGGGVDVYKTLIELISSLPNINGIKLHKISDSFFGDSGENTFRLFVSLLLWWLARTIRYISLNNIDTAKEIPDDEVQIIKSLTKSGLEPWLNCWDRINKLLYPSEAIYLDRKQITLNVFSELAEATRH
jgi:DNA polymerase-3 subunit delta'